MTELVKTESGANLGVVSLGNFYTKASSDDAEGDGEYDMMASEDHEKSKHCVYTLCWALLEGLYTYELMESP